jgi:hypothetical protein
MDGELKYIHVSWIPAIPAGMTGFVTLMYNDEGAAWKRVSPIKYICVSFPSIPPIMYLCNLPIR